MSTPSGVRKQSAFTVTGAGGGGPGFGVIWKWNETDLSQFGTNLLTPGAGTVVPSVVNNGRRNVIRLACTGFTGAVFLPITQTFGAAWQLFGRVIASTQLTSAQRAGFWFMGNGLTDASCYAVGYLKAEPASVTTTPARLEGGAVTLAATKRGGSNAWDPTVGDTFSMGFRRYSALPLGASPIFYSYQKDQGSAAGSNQGGGTMAIANWGAFAGGWVGQSALGTIGLAIHATGALTSNIDFGDLVVSKEVSQY